MRALFVFTPAESKRFIARAVARLPEVEYARTGGEIAIGHGSTNVFVAEEIFGARARRGRHPRGVRPHPPRRTIGWSYGILSARGCHLIVPVGLEKLVPSVREAARSCGQDTLYYCQGIRVGMIPIMNTTVVTEIEAFRILFGLRAVHIGGGGMKESQGSVVLVAEG